MKIELEGRGAVREQIGVTLTEHRQALLKAIDSVNPAGWDHTPLAGEGDLAATSRVAWGWVPAAAILIGLFVFAGGSLIASGDLARVASGVWPYVIAALTAVAAFPLGWQLLDRVGVTLDRDGLQSDIIGPRNGYFRLTALVVTVLVAIALLSLGVFAHSGLGVIESILLVAGFGMLVLMGGYTDHLLSGLDFLARAAVYTAVFSTKAGWWLICTAALCLAAALCWLVDGVVTLIASPILVVRAWWKRRDPPSRPPRRPRHDRSPKPAHRRPRLLGDARAGSYAATQSSVSILVDLSATWHNPRDDTRNLQLLGSVGRAVSGAARLMPKPMVVRYHQIGRDSLGREAICQATYRKSLFGFAAPDGQITSEHQFLQYVTVECPQVLVHQPVQPTTEITAAVITAMRATEMTGSGIPKFLIILSDFKEESPTAYSLRDISLGGVRTVMLYRVLPEDRRRPAALNARLSAWRNAFITAKARVRLFEDIAVNPADLQSVLESMI